MKDPHAFPHAFQDARSAPDAGLALDFIAAGTERRQHERRLLASTAHVVLPERHPLEVQTVDISLGGIGIVAPLNLAPSRFVHIRLQVPNIPHGVNPIIVPAQVMYSVLSGRKGGFLIGLQYADIPREALLVVQRYLKGQPPPPPPAGVLHPLGRTGP